MHCMCNTSGHRGVTLSIFFHRNAATAVWSSSTSVYLNPAAAFMLPLRCVSRLDECDLCFNYPLSHVQRSGLLQLNLATPPPLPLPFFRPLISQFSLSPCMKAAYLYVFFRGLKCVRACVCTCGLRSCHTFSHHPTSVVSVHAF